MVFESAQTVLRIIGKLGCSEIWDMVKHEIYGIRVMEKWLFLCVDCSNIWFFKHYFDTL